ncbi:hypothetical protein FEM48_Zijuj12G0176600 [Ziziphus jujuba var. spinosa]|uniref:Uncharacterized protein n=1 Tax=Ziziphus jujuba var. spinosa TaxID=714518 RepID=A0A978UEQ1_ZIZJJ|nr:hypothetical protein FEM48_Zijuj12G0176600 [Ziziphus jujuba var. spinosa]
MFFQSLDYGRDHHIIEVASLIITNRSLTPIERNLSGGSLAEDTSTAGKSDSSSSKHIGTVKDDGTIEANDTGDIKPSFNFGTGIGYDQTVDEAM